MMGYDGTHAGITPGLPRLQSVEKDTLTSEH